MKHENLKQLVIEAMTNAAIQKAMKRDRPTWSSGEDIAQKGAESEPQPEDLGVFSGVLDVEEVQDELKKHFPKTLKMLKRRKLEPDPSYPMNLDDLAKSIKTKLENQEDLDYKTIASDAGVKVQFIKALEKAIVATT